VPLPPAQPITSPHLAERLPFSHAMRAGPFVFVSGQASIDERGEVVADTFAGEMRRTLANLAHALAAAGLTLRDVVQARGYLRDEANFPEYNRIWREVFRAPFPARTTIMRCLGGLQVEIDVVAYDPTGAP
jgi:2-iminobutanoate/2-iminopropanoate deaminase